MKRVIVSTVGEMKEPLLTVYYGRSSYEHHNRVYLALTDAPMYMRNAIATNMQEDFQNSSCFCASMGVQVTLITSDRKVLFCRRTTKVKVNAKIFIGSATETMDHRDVDKNGFPDPWLTCKRCLDERLGVRLDNKDIDAIKITALHCRRDMMAGFLAYIDMAKTIYVRKTSAELMEHYTLGIGRETRLKSDKWKFVDLDPKITFDYMEKHNISSNGVIFAMRALLGEESVNNELFKRYTVSAHKDEVESALPVEQEKLEKMLTLKTEYKHSERKLSPGAVSRVHTSPR
jgi:hypothetical protein